MFFQARGLVSQAEDLSAEKLSRMRVVALAASGMLVVLGAVGTVYADVDAMKAQEIRLVKDGLAKAAYMPVVVEVVRVSLKEMSEQGAHVVARTRQMSEALLAELGDGALREGMHVGANGFATVYVNDKGLQKLMVSKDRWFGPASHWYQRSVITRDADTLKRLHDAVSGREGAEVVVTLNVEGLSHEFSRDGAVAVGLADRDAVKAKAGSLKRSVAHLSSGRAYQALQQAERGDGRAGEDAKVKMVVGLRELLALSANEALRDVVLAADVKPMTTAPIVDADLDAWIQAHGVADVMIALKRPVPVGNLSKISELAHVASVRRTIESVKAEARGAPLLKGLEMLEAMQGKVTREELALLRKDNRIERISAVKIQGRPAVDVANGSIMNMPMVWDTWNVDNPYRGQGAALVVMDSGMQTNLNSFASARRQGINRVTRQRCFSTTGSALGNGAVTSVCPHPQDAAFDSAAYNSAHYDINTCPYVASACAHGTQVAAVGAGQRAAPPVYGYSWTSTSLSGAYEADLWAYMINSRDNGTGQPRLAIQDLIAAMNDVIGASTPWSTANKIVVNVSWAGDCQFSGIQNTVEYQTLSNAVQILKGRGIPVVASTGNEGNPALGFPSCVPGVIKAGSVPNTTAMLSDGSGPAWTRSSQQSNFVDPATIPGEYLFVAPGGGMTFGYGPLVTSSVIVPTLSPTPVGTMAMGGTTLVQGTSFAAPLVSGAYTIFKGAVPEATVYDMSVWLSAPGRRYAVRAARTDGFVPSGGPPRYYNLIRFQNLL